MEAARRITMFCIIVSILAITGTSLAEELKVRHPAQSEIGKPVTCPVMDSRFEVTKDTPVIDYKGKSYYFCCESCIDIFKTDPDKYVTRMEKSAK